MVIRKAEESDLPALTDIYNYEVLHGTATFDTEPWTEQERAEWLHAHNVGCHPLFVAEYDGRTAAYASLSAYRPKDAYAGTAELSVYVDPAFRRRGIGRVLMAHTINWARECPDIHTVVSVITGGNEASIRLHREFGFLECGTLREVGKKFGRYLDTVEMQLMV